ncbi:MAG TPA: hypothetical protein VH166_05350 [Mycobacterium sp.]|nr:hypothetical protein [Mycobacterium sp.]
MTRLALLDQAAFLRLRATGQGSVCQCTWVYGRGVDIDELRVFNENLGTGLLGRRIEPSPLPFGRHRWVVDTHAPDIDVTLPRPHAAIGAWIEQRGRVRVDPEWGPTFHLGVLPLDDGGAAVTLVASHCVADGLGLATAIAEAVKGESRDFGYPQANSRGWRRAVSEDLTDAVRALPAVFRALIATLMILLRLSPDVKAASAAPHRRVDAGDDDEAELPSVTMQTDAAAWDARARELNGSSNTLFIAFAARLALRIGRVHPAGNNVTVVLPVSERGTDDDRGNALTSITLAVDGQAVTDDMSRVRADVKNRLTSLTQQPNEMLAGLPLIPFTPRWLVRHTEGIAMASGQLPVGVSNLGRFDTVVGRIDGGDATEVSMRLAEQGITRRRIERADGQLFCGTGTVNGSRFVTVVAYQSGAQNTASSTREFACAALADLHLSATTVR